MSEGIQLHANRHEWQLFGSFTYRNVATMPASVRYPLIFQFLRQTEDILQVPFKQLEFLIREELGEKTNRLHWHALFSGITPERVNPTTCFALMNLWEKCGGGMARIHVFNTRLSGVEYVLKGLGDVTAASIYELGKFKEQDTLRLIPALALLRQWSWAIEPDRRHRKARDMRRHPRRDRKAHRSRKNNAATKPWSPAHPADDVRIYV